MTSYIDRDAARAIDEDYEEEEVYDDALGEPESETADNKEEYYDSWEDTRLIDFWDQALKGYETYHDRATLRPPSPSAVIPKPKVIKKEIKAQISQDNEQTKAEGVKSAKQVSFEEEPPKQLQSEEASVTPQQETVPTQGRKRKLTQDDAVEDHSTHKDTSAADQSSYYYDNNYYYNQDPSYWQAPPPPMPPQPMSMSMGPSASEDEALSNLIMAWYYCGYYTGLYQARRRRR